VVLQENHVVLANKEMHHLEETSGIRAVKPHGITLNGAKKIVYSYWFWRAKSHHSALSKSWNTEFTV
jgi:hypothetical protein